MEKLYLKKNIKLSYRYSDSTCAHIHEYIFAKTVQSILHENASLSTPRFDPAWTEIGRLVHKTITIRMGFQEKKKKKKKYYSQLSHTNYYVLPHRSLTEGPGIIKIILHCTYILQQWPFTLTQLGIPKCGKNNSSMVHLGLICFVHERELFFHSLFVL